MISRFDRVILVGAGGIGSLLAEPLARLLAWHERGRGAELTIADGDAYEPRNAERQLVDAGDAGANKAAALARRVGRALGAPGEERLRLLAHAAYVDAAVLEVLCDAPGHTVAVLAVDNQATASAALAALTAVAARRASERGYAATWLRPANGAGAAWGIVTIAAHLHRRGAWLTVDPRETVDSLREPGDRIPGGGCAAVAPAEPQRLAANALAAAITLAYVTALLDGRPVPAVWLGELTPGARDCWRAGPADTLAGP